MGSGEQGTCGVCEVEIFSFQQTPLLKSLRKKACLKV
jgi:hypothetical protein